MADHEEARGVVTLEVPTHVASMMDGDGRWARRRCLPAQALPRAGPWDRLRLFRACIHFNINRLSNPFSFLVHLCQADGSMIFNYDSTIFGNGADNGKLATIGIRDTTFSDPPTDVLQWGFHNGAEANGGYLLGSENFQIGFGFAAAVPEPTSIALVSLGATGIVGSVWYRKRLVSQAKGKACQ